MKQTLVLALFSFVVSAASATWFAAYLAPPRAAGSERRPDSALVVSGPSMPAPTEPRSDSAAAAKDTPPPPTRPAGPSAPDTAGDGARAKTVSKILAAMKPKAAADIVARLTDDEVDRIVRQLNPKQVAALLAALPEERAAALSRRLLESKPGRQGGT